MATQIVRVDFDDKIKEIIAKRAGFRCSFPGCNKTLVGPGVSNDETISIGECAHIFSAVPKGPRTDGGLSDLELKRPENGIYLCRNHHKIIDSKAKDNKYTSDLLNRYKTRHEFLISAELGEYTYPINWINQLNISGGIFKTPIAINLGKVTLLTGENGTGKSTIVEILYSYFVQRIVPRWNRPEITYSTKIKLDNPILSTFTAIINKNQLFYDIKGVKQPFVPYDFFVLFLRDIKRPSKVDDLKTIADYFGLDRAFVKSMLNTSGVKHGLITRKIEIEEVRIKPYQVDNLKVDIGKKGFHRFGGYSGTEQSSIILDIAISFATEISKFKSVLLLMDWSRIYNFDDSNIKKYFDYLQSSQAHFQSIIVSHNERPKLDWSGWTIAKLTSTKDGIQVIQNKK